MFLTCMESYPMRPTATQVPKASMIRPDRRVSQRLRRVAEASAPTKRCTANTTSTSMVVLKKMQIEPSRMHCGAKACLSYSTPPPRPHRLAPIPWWF